MNSPSVPTLGPGVKTNGLGSTWLSGAIAFAVLLSVALVGIESWQMWQVRQATLRNAKSATTSLAQSISLQAENTLKTADTVVASIRERVEADGVRPKAIDRLYGLMRSLATALPAIHEMGITDRHGVAIVKSLVRDPKGLNYSERDYFRFLAAHHSRDIFIGEPVRSKIDDSLNITMSRRIDGPHHAFEGVVVSSVSMDFFRRMFASVEGTSGSYIALVSNDGTVLARSQPPFGDQELAAIVAAGNKLDYASPEGHVRRVGSISRLQSYPMAVIVAQDSAAVLANWRSQVENHAAVVVCLLVALGISGWRAEQAARVIRMQALRDSLTGLANRRSLDEALDLEFRRAARTGSEVSLLMADLDLFKNFNDTYGHQAGDECLVAVAQAIRSVASRPGDVVARYGGEEIVVLLPCTSREGAAQVADEIHAAVASLRIPHAASPHGKVTISIGVACCESVAPIDSWRVLLRSADAALYEAKASGRNAVRVSVKEAAVAQDEIPLVPA